MSICSIQTGKRQHDPANDLGGAVQKKIHRSLAYLESMSSHPWEVYSTGPTGRNCATTSREDHVVHTSEMKVSVTGLDIIVTLR